MPHLLNCITVLVHFSPICYFCGLGEENLINDDHIKELKNHMQLYYLFVSFVRVMASLLFVSSPLTWKKMEN